MSQTNKSQHIQDHEYWLKNIETTLKPEKNTKTPKKRWERLHDLDKIRKETRNFIVSIKKEEMKKNEECTFKPKISESSKKLAENYAKLDFHQRSDYWQKDKNEKIKEMFESTKDADLENCTFKPKITKIKNFKKNFAKKNEMKNHGVDKFIERQKIAREKRKNKKIFNNKKKNKNLNKSYTGIYLKKNDEEFFDSMKNKSFNDNIGDLHNFLNSFEINL